MNWKKYWNENASLNVDNIIGQVQRKDFESTILTVNHIVRALDIKRIDKVLDVCCGNGLITQQVSKKAKHVFGIDHSEILLKTASKVYNEVNITYVNGSALTLSETIGEEKFDKIYMQFSFQYFDKKKEGEKVILEMLNCLNPKGKIFIGDIPNQEKFSSFYNTKIKKLRFYKDNLLRKNQMGKFWDVSELDTICNKLNAKGTFLEQSKQLPYSHYRFDYLIEN